MAVAEVADGPGYSGPFSQIYAWFVPATSATSAQTPVMLKFTTYGTPEAIPTSVQVPCGGSGTVEFSSCPYLAPCAFGWSPDYVAVRFENLAA